MTFESDKMFDALNQTDITSLLDSQSGISGLFDSRVVPEFFTLNKTINFYLISPYSGALEWNEYIYSVDCRAKTDKESREIAQAVFDKLNRADFTDYHTYCDILPTIPPEDDNDVFNTPVEVNLKTRN